MKELATLQDLMQMHLHSLFEAESQWSVLQRESAALIASNELKILFLKGSDSALAHAGRLKQILKAMGTEAFYRRHAVVSDFGKEIRELRLAAADPEVLDAALIVTHQCMNHYLIAKYGAASSFAALLHLEEMAEELHELMEEEKEEDDKLTSIAEENINPKATSVIIY